MLRGATSILASTIALMSINAGALGNKSIYDADEAAAKKDRRAL